MALVSDPTARGAAVDITRRPEPFQGRLLESALQPLLDGKRLSVLDTSPPSSSTIAYFNGYRCRLSITGLASAVIDLDAEEDEARRRDHVRRLLPEDVFGDIDLVLCWDLLNYLRPPAIATLMEHMRHLMCRGAMVHALVAYGATAIPDPPWPVILRSDGWIARGDAASPGTRSAPRYSTGELQRVMPGFQVEKAVLLKNGTQEYLFRR